MKKRNLLCMLSAVMAILAVTACGGGGGEDAEGDVSAPPPELSIKRVLVADLTDAAVLVQPFYLSYLKDAGETDGEDEAIAEEFPTQTATTSRTDAVFLQKVTTGNEIKPALYVKEETSFTIPVEPTASEEPEEEVSSDDSAAPAETPVTETEDTSEIALNDLINGSISVATTMNGGVFFSFGSPLEYNGDKKCDLFKITNDTAIECADADAEYIDGLTSDRAGNLFYTATKGNDRIIRRYSVEGTITDLTKIDQFITSYETKYYPDGNILIAYIDKDGKAHIRTITSAGEKDSLRSTTCSGASYEVSNSFGGFDSFSLTHDGTIIAKGYCKDKNTGAFYLGIFSINPEDAYATLLLDFTSNEISSNSFGFFMDSDFNTWFKYGVSKSEVRNSLSPTTYYDVFISPVSASPVKNPAGRGVYNSFMNSNAYEYSYDISSTNPDIWEFYELVYNENTVTREKMFELPDEYGISSYLVGRDGKLRFVESLQYQLATLEDDGTISYLDVFFADSESGKIYSLAPQAQ